MSAIDVTSVSDSTLIEHLRELVRREREVLIDVLHHLNEVERRRLHLKLGYRSLFAYCTDTLKYSESAAGRRVQAARVIRRYPSVAGLFERGEVNLSTVSKVAGIALSRNDPRLFDRIRGMTQDEAAAVASEYRPRDRPRDRVRPVSRAGRARPYRAGRNASRGHAGRVTGSSAGGRGTRGRAGPSGRARTGDSAGTGARTERRALPRWE